MCRFQPIFERREASFLERGQPAISMGVGARLARAEFAFFSGLGAAGRAAHRERLLWKNLHGMHDERRETGRLINFDQPLKIALVLISGADGAESRPRPAVS
jgi:hypothetical protein